MTSLLRRLNLKWFVFQINVKDKAGQTALTIGVALGDIRIVNELGRSHSTTKAAPAVSAYPTTKTSSSAKAYIFTRSLKSSGSSVC